jgi:hypothetical protein
MKQPRRCMDHIHTPRIGTAFSINRIPIPSNTTPITISMSCTTNCIYSNIPAIRPINLSTNPAALSLASRYCLRQSSGSHGQSSLRTNCRHPDAAKRVITCKGKRNRKGGCATVRRRSAELNGWRVPCNTMRGVYMEHSRIAREMSRQSNFLRARHNRAVYPETVQAAAKAGHEPPGFTSTRTASDEQDRANVRRCAKLYRVEESVMSLMESVQSGKNFFQINPELAI